jgi:hypothetical protein
MYIRWQSRKRTSYQPAFGHGFQDTGWRAILVENVRVDGKPKQRHIAYLAGFPESALAHPAQQMFLWDRIEDRLKGLSNRISAKDRDAITKALVKVIGKPPTKAQRAALDRKREAILGDLVELGLKVKGK